VFSRVLVSQKLITDKYSVDEFYKDQNIIFTPRKANKQYQRLLNRVLRCRWSDFVIRNSKNDERLLYDGVFVTTPALIASVLLKDSFPDLSQLLQKMNYNPVTLAVVRYKKNIFNPSVRAIVFDRHTALSNAGCYGIHDLNIVRYTFSGNKAMQTISEDSDPYEIIDLAEKTLNRYIPVSKDLREDFVYKHFPIGLCAYTPFHHQIFADIYKELSASKCLGLTGDYFRGASLEACFRAAKENVDVFDKKMEGH